MPLGTELSQLQFSSGHFRTHKLKPKLKYESISNTLHLLSTPDSVPHVCALHIPIVCEPCCMPF